MHRGQPLVTTSVCRLEEPSLFPNLPIDRQATLPPEPQKPCILTVHLMYKTFFHIRKEKTWALQLWAYMLCYSANRICAAVPREVVYIPQTVIVWYHEMSVVCFHTNAHLKTDTARLTNTHRGMHFRLDRKFVGRGQAHTQKFWPYVPQLSLICLYQIHQSLEWKSWLISACRMNWLTKCRHVYNMTKI